MESYVTAYLHENNITPKILPLIERIFSKAWEHRQTEKNDINKRRQDGLAILIREMTKVENAIVNAATPELRSKFEDKWQGLNTQKMDLQKIIDENSIHPDEFKRILTRSKLLFLSSKDILNEPNLELRQILLGVQTSDHISWS